jgi:hypothetical protein
MRRVTAPPSNHGGSNCTRTRSLEREEKSSRHLRQFVPSHGGASALWQFGTGRRLGETRSRVDRVGRRRSAGQEARRRSTGYLRSAVRPVVECPTPTAKETTSRRDSDGRRPYFITPTGDGRRPWCRGCWPQALCVMHQRRQGRGTRCKCKCKCLA